MSPKEHTNLGAQVSESPAEATKTCTNPKCRQANPQPLSNFWEYPAAKDGRTHRCRACTPRQTRKRPETVGGRPVPKPRMQIRDQNVLSCPHLRWATGHLLVLGIVPDFFSNHEEAPAGHEWQLCLRCGYARCVDLTRPKAVGLRPLKPLWECVVDVPPYVEEVSPPPLEPERDVVPLRPPPEQAQPTPQPDVAGPRVVLWPGVERDLSLGVIPQHFFRGEPLPAEHPEKPEEARDQDFRAMQIISTDEAVTVRVDRATWRWPDNEVRALRERLASIRGDVAVARTRLELLSASAGTAELALWWHEERARTAELQIEVVELRATLAAVTAAQAQQKEEVANHER